MKIDITPHGEQFKAEVNGHYDVGDTPAEAIGKLAITWPHLFGIIEIHEHPDVIAKRHRDADKVAQKMVK